MTMTHYPDGPPAPHPTQGKEPDPRKWIINRNSRGMLCWYQRWLEAWWIMTGKWTLHRAWQDGMSYGASNEYRRVVGNWGDLGPILGEVVDVTWGRAMEDGSVPSTKIKNELIAKARETMVTVRYGQY